MLRRLVALSALFLTTIYLPGEDAAAAPTLLFWT
jgi:hypothetical protein